jgi:2,4-dienoyl-CoA reductase-like NADH-dependent reductase (Old Yellow Enzyme family)
MGAVLIQPIKLRGLTVTNLISPMTQFSATNGTPGDWHMVHLGQFSRALALCSQIFLACPKRATRLPAFRSLGFSGAGGHPHQTLL